MATKLLKDVTRQTLGLTDRRGNPVIVTLKGGDVLEFRVKGKRKRDVVSLGHCFRLAEILSIESHYKTKLDDYNKRKKLGEKRLRIPKRSIIPATSFYFKATKF